MHIGGSPRMGSAPKYHTYPAQGSPPRISAAYWAEGQLLRLHVNEPGQRLCSISGSSHQVALAESFPLDSLMGRAGQCKISLALNLGCTSESPTGLLKLPTPRLPQTNYIRISGGGPQWQHLLKPPPPSLSHQKPRLGARAT